MKDLRVNIHLDIVELHGVIDALQKLGSGACRPAAGHNRFYPEATDRGLRMRSETGQGFNESLLDQTMGRQLDSLLQASSS
jgi:hypothetical protein